MKRIVYCSQATQDMSPEELVALLELARAAGPCRMNFGIDIEVQRVAFLAPGRAGLEFGAVGHLDRDHVIIRVDFAFHCRFSSG